LKVDFLVKFYLSFFLPLADFQAYGSDLFLEKSPGIKTKKKGKKIKTKHFKMLWNKAMFLRQQQRLR